MQVKVSSSVTADCVAQALKLSAHTQRRLELRPRPAEAVHHRPGGPGASLLWASPHTRLTTPRATGCPVLLPRQCRDLPLPPTRGQPHHLGSNRCASHVAECG